ncbi:L,D-transpeptidase family protein [Allonocardiopsis opalescens]|uniref:Peptidoglycan hydrolase-like protein with peptidoglycan-binding domain n=1 Tax=Allonocardiopsis opalescens TaxID=1144618 RepID=A0A2T0Q989_9ACTN|nr:L,D-transpeptidase family protein [Allonocardiopsis opalescens]PRY00415.1 peptidoglycan hydrolase-like protein with peptidoglycan-binding domain [Allonocardiopsis opalescens]
MSLRVTGTPARYPVTAAALALTAALATGGCAGAGAVAGAAASSAPSAAESARPSEQPPAESAPAESASPAAGTASAEPSEEPDEPELLRQGDSGAEVERLQQRLMELGYWIDSADGEFGELTTQAVYALQKAAGIDRDGVVGPGTQEALDDGIRPEASTESGRAVEIDLGRQLLLVVNDGEVEQVFNTSTGSGETYESQGSQRVAVTPEGDYEVFRAVDAWDPGPLGELYRPKYFNGGIAVHGYPSVPPYPASHGCARVSLAGMDWLWESGYLDQGARVLVR